MFTSAQLRDSAGITYRQLDYWTRTGYLRAHDRAKDTSGFPRRFDDTELPVAVLLGALSTHDLLAGGRNRGRPEAAAYIWPLINHVRAHGLTGSVPVGDGLVTFDLAVLADRVTAAA